MVYSASAIEATVSYHDPQFFLKRQAAYALVALVPSSWLVSRVDYHRLDKLTYPILGGGHACCSSRASSASVTRRRRDALARASARSTSSPPRWRSSRSCCGSRTRSRRRPSKVEDASPSASLPHLLMAGFFMLLCLKQPDFGSAVVLLLLTFTMLFVAGAKVGYMLGALDPRRRSAASGSICSKRVSLRALPRVARTWTSTARTSPTSRSSRS